MKIVKIDIYRSPILLKEPFITSLGPDTHAKNVIVVLHTDEGLTGFGECSPYMPINGESMDTAAVVGRYLAKLLLNTDPLSIDQHTAAFDKLIYGNASIKSAFDIALHDIAAQHAGVPLYRFLGGHNDKPLITDYTVSLGEPERMAEDAQKIIDKGFQIIKVKLGQAPEQDLQRIQRIRERVNNSIPIRIDANQGWTTAGAMEVLQALHPYHIEYCEEPIPRHAYIQMAEVRRSSPIPIMADESCFDHHDAERLINLKACDSFNIKLGKSSGLFKAMKISALAEAAGLPVQVGGFLESRLAFTASAHFALACMPAKYFDFDTPLMFMEDPVAGGIQYGKGGRITVPDSPGLGATIDPHYLKRLEKMSI